MSDRSVFVEFVDVVKRFGSHVALTDCNLKIAEGEFVSLLGPSGCGKTTTLRLLAGLLRPDSGRILLGGSVLSSPDIHVPTERRNLGMVFQSFAVWPHMTVRENVGMPLRIRGVASGAIAERVARMLALCRLNELEDRHPHELSGGQQQRVALARALVYEPRLLLLDEPLSNLDAALREEMRHELRELHRVIGTTFLLVTHDQVEAMSLSDRVVVMDGGCIQQVGTPREIFLEPGTSFVAQFVGATNMLKGSISSVERQGERESVRLQAGPFAIALSRAAIGAKAGECMLAIPQDGLRVRPAGTTAAPGDSTYRGRIRDSYFIGRAQQLVVEVDDVVLKVVQPSGEPPPAGTPVEITLVGESLRVYQ